MADEPKPRNKDDRELLELLTKLYTIQEDIGAKPKTTIEEKRSKAENAAMMGKGRAAKKAGTRFVELKGMIVDRLKKIHTLMEEESERNRNNLNYSVVAGGNNPKDAIQRQATIREEIRQAGDEWTELDGLYKNEARKRKSKFTQEQLDIQQTLVQRLYAEIEKVKEMQSMGYARGNRDEMVAQMNAQALTNLDFGETKDADGAWAGAAGPSTGGGVELTQQQALRLEQIESRDREFDKQLDDIAVGLDDLNDIAKMQQEEVERQNVMLSSVGKKIDDAYDHIENVNAKMKDTLNEVRAADKICVDIMCIVLMVGLGAVLYQMIKTQT